MTKAEKTYEAAQTALKQAEATLRDLQLKISNQAEVAVAEDKLVREAIRAGHSPGKDVHAKRREHRDIIEDFRLEAEAAQTVVSERQAEATKAELAWIREQRLDMSDEATELGRLLKGFLSEIGETVSELEELDTEDQRARSRSRYLHESQGTSEANIPYVLSIYPSGVWKELRELLVQVERHELDQKRKAVGAT